MALLRPLNPHPQSAGAFNIARRGGRSGSRVVHKAVQLSAGPLLNLILDIVDAFLQRDIQAQCVQPEFLQVGQDIDVASSGEDMEACSANSAQGSPKGHATWRR